jgi:hypothetical protein
MNGSTDQLVAAIRHELESRALARDSTGQAFRQALDCCPPTVAEEARETHWRLAEDDRLPDAIRRRTPLDGAAAVRSSQENAFT